MYGSKGVNESRRYVQRARGFVWGGEKERHMIRIEIPERGVRWLSHRAGQPVRS